MPTNKFKNQKGVTILISVLILSSIVILALAISDIVGRSNQSSKTIGLSEVSYFAAEKGVEQALYSIERERSIENLESASGDLADTPGASWSTTLSVLDSEDEEVGSMTCDELEDADEGLCVGIWKNNKNKQVMHVKLDGLSRTFQLELDFIGLTLPNNLSIDGIDSDTSSTTIFYLKDGTTETVTGEDLSIDISKQPIVKIISKSSAGMEFEITTGSANNTIPLGFLITSTGIYRDQKRVIEVQKNNWQIY